MNFARDRIKFSNSDIVDHFDRLGYHVNYDQLNFTTETVSDFVEARETVWHQPGKIAARDDGLLIVQHAQPRPGQPTRDIVIVSLGGARIIMGALNPPDKSIGVPRYARTM